MKTLYLIRHAKSSWDNHLLSDFDRPLNPRGLKDSKNMPAYLKNIGVKFDFIISSTANRAKTTAERFNEVFKVPDDKVIFTDDMYHAYNDTVIELVKHVNDEVDHLAVFGHNPTITLLVNELAELGFDNIPTCGVVALKFNTGSWSEFDKDRAEIIFYEFPKGINV